MTRRSLFAALFGSLATWRWRKITGKPEFASHGRKIGTPITLTKGWSQGPSLQPGDTIRITEYWPLENYRLLFVEANKDLDFLAGKSWTQTEPDPQSAQRDKSFGDDYLKYGCSVGTGYFRIMNPDGSVKFTNIG